MLVGRNSELNSLRQLREKKSASLVVVTGRRRIGKSSLIEQFGSEFKRFIQFQGLSPRAGLTKQNQLDAFADQYRSAFELPENIQFNDWTQAFEALAKKTAKGEFLVFLDEVSWLGMEDSDFAGKLKIAWDTKFKSNSKLILVVCGSVSSWIGDNILKDAGFVGRVSLVIRLTELDLSSCASFWTGRKDRISAYEKLKLLAVTGGVPKYLEEIRPNDSADANIKRLCFSKGGYLFEDFDRIFNDVFGKRSASYRMIVSKLVTRSYSASELAKALGKGLDRQFASRLRDLELSGFISRDARTKLVQLGSNRDRHYRIADNYLRFYLRYIAKNIETIEAGLFEFGNLENLPGWDSIVGLQFENLILNHLPEILRAMDLAGERIVQAGPFIQKKGSRSEGCQVDLMLSCRADTFYLAEIKFRREIDLSVVREVKTKLEKIKFPRRSSVRPILICAGEIHPAVYETDFFDRVLNVEKLVS